MKFNQKNTLFLTFLSGYFFFTSLSYNIVHAQKSREAIASSYANKDLAKIQKELQELITKIDQLKAFSSLKISGGPATEIKTRHINNFTLISQEELSKRFKSSLEEVQLYQKITNDTSWITVRKPYDLTDYPKPYQELELKEPKLTLNRLKTFDGASKEMPNIDKDYDVYPTTDLRKIEHISAVFSYQHIKKIEKITLQKGQKTTGKINLLSIKNDALEFETDLVNASKIIYIEALDATGKALWEKSSFNSSSNVKSQETYLTEVQKFASNAIKQLKAKKITSKDALIDYLYKHQPSEKTISKEAPKKKFLYTYAGEIASVNIYKNPVITSESITFNITNSTKYIDGITVAKKNGKEGLINKKGQWIVPPKYGRINDMIGDYFYVYNGNDKKLHLLDKKEKILKPVSYHIMSERIYNDRYLEICKAPNHNFEKGLVDLNNYKVLLSPKRRSLDTNPYFYSSNTSKDKNDFYEIYRFSDHKKIVTGYFEDVYLDNELIIVKYLKKLAAKPKGSYSRIGKDYYHSYFDIYNNKGKKINTKSYNNLPDNKSFGNDNLLLVDNTKDRTNRNTNYVFINRKGIVQNIDLSNYSTVKSFSNGLAIVQDKTTRKRGFIDTKGKIVIPMKYKYANHFIGGTAKVEFTDRNGKFKTVLINNKNEIIFTFPNSVYSYTSTHDGKKARYVTKGGKESKVFNHKGEDITNKKN